MNEWGSPRDLLYGHSNKNMILKDNIERQYINIIIIIKATYPSNFLVFFLLFFNFQTDHLYAFLVMIG